MSFISHFKLDVRVYEGYELAWKWYFFGSSINSENTFWIWRTTMAIFKVQYDNGVHCNGFIYSICIAIQRYCMNIDFGDYSTTAKKQIFGMADKKKSSKRQEKNNRLFQLTVVLNIPRRIRYSVHIKWNINTPFFISNIRSGIESISFCVLNVRIFTVLQKCMEQLQLSMYILYIIKFAETLNWRWRPSH